MPTGKALLSLAEPVHVLERFLDQRQPLLDLEEAAALLRVDANHDAQLVDDQAGATDHVEMAQGHGIERTRVDAAFHEGGRYQPGLPAARPSD